MTSEQRKWRRIARDILADGKVVSTVDLAVDHGFGGTPLWFETMVFPAEGEFGDLDCNRYETEEEARAGHAAMVKEWGAKAEAKS